MYKQLCLFTLALVPLIVDFPGIPSKASYPIILFAALLAYTKFNLKTCTGFVQAMFLLIVVAVARYNQYSVDMLKDLGLMLIGIFPFLVNIKLKVNLKILNLLFMGGFLISVGSALWTYHFSLSSFIVGDFGDIEKGAYPYTFGLLAILWGKEDSRSWMLLNILFCALGGKRIAIAAVVACVLVAYLFRRKEGEAGKLIKLGLAAFVVGWLFVSFMLTTNLFDEIIMRYTGRSANSFTMGRQLLYTYVFEMTPFPNYWGIGPGNTLETLAVNTGLNRMHNDFLKIYSENGLFLTIGYFFLLLRKVTYKQVPTILYIYALFMTTNTFIYPYMIFMYGLFLEPQRYFYYHKRQYSLRL